VRSTAGTWSRHTVAQVSDCPNRPIVLIDQQNGVAHLFYTAPGPPNYTCTSSGGAIYKKTSPLSSISFPSGRGTPVIVDADTPIMHDVSSTKGSVNGATGIAVLAVNNSTRNYWHHYESLGGPPTPSPSPSPTFPPGPSPSPSPSPSPTPPPPPPVAAFSGSPTAGVAPLTVNFIDSSSGSPSAWSWSFGDGGTSTAQHPSHTYANAGTYSVTLQVTNPSGSDTLTRANYITVSPPPPDFTVSASPVKRTVTAGGNTTYLVTLTPSHGFTGPVALTVTGQRAGITTSFSQNPVIVTTTASSTLFVSTSTLTKQGGETLTITATSGALTHTATVSLQVKK
jgi:PKD repeat protein